MPAATVPLSSLDALILPFAVGLPVPSARRFARQAAIEFCEHTNCWREMFTLVVDSSNEAIVTPAYATVHRIEYAEYDGNRLQPTQYTDISGADWSAEGVPAYITQANPNTVSLIPPPAALEPVTITLSCFLKPIEGTSMAAIGSETVDDLDVIPAFMLTQHAQAIANGALARALRIPGQPFSNPQEALNRHMQFKQDCDTHFASNITMQHRPPPRSRMHEY